MNPLTTVKWPLIIGFAVAVIIASLIGGFAFNEMSFARWLHIVSGVFWIGLLYYFNAVQTPAMAAAAADQGGPGGAGVNKYVSPLAPLWFPSSALAPSLMGAWLMWLVRARAPFSRGPFPAGCAWRGRGSAARSRPVAVPADLPQQVARALAEDIGSGDLTAALVPADRVGRATVITRESAVVCGIPYVDATFHAVDPRVRLEWRVAEGDSVAAHHLLFTVEGPARAR